jgi:hypothetical protein
MLEQYMHLTLWLSERPDCSCSFVIRGYNTIRYYNKHTKCSWFVLLHWVSFNLSIHWKMMFQNEHPSTRAYLCEFASFGLMSETSHEHKTSSRIVIRVIFSSFMSFMCSLSEYIQVNNRLHTYIFASYYRDVYML